MIYFDNSATSYPKPPCVKKAVEYAYNHYFANSGRGSSKDTLLSAKSLYDARTSISDLVGTIPENVIFTYNATYALNMAIRGVVKKGMTVALERFAHNSVLRPLYALEKEGVTLEFLDTSLERDSVMISCFERLVRDKKIDVLVLTHTSNVTGKTLPVKRLSRVCREFGIILILDASQSIGSIQVDMKELGVDVLASSGHKGLYGIMGSGFLAISENFKGEITPLITGGSGMFSKEKEMPPFMPEHLEGGTVSTISAASMKAGADFIRKIGVEEIGDRERRLRQRILEGMSVIPKVKIYNSSVNAHSILLFNLSTLSPENLANVLDKNGIEGRAGFHCAPLVHELLKKGDEKYEGAMRLSVGYFNTEKECDKALLVLNKIVKGEP